MYTKNSFQQRCFDKAISMIIALSIYKKFPIELVTFMYTGHIKILSILSLGHKYFYCMFVQIEIVGTVLGAM